ncbi:hypothetical protein CBM2637_B10090 [Cupriavidus taiwanensis]|nr:hypothetical protein CBM2637_B10090 [Cupriavidus taiwanensis]SPA55100.1 protein of unknown function [Cupriavidus taiwanensis]
MALNGLRRKSVPVSACRGGSRQAASLRPPFSAITLDLSARHAPPGAPLRLAAQARRTRFCVSIQGLSLSASLVPRR